MEDLKPIQARHLKRLLTSERISKTKFAETIGVSAVSVSRWVNAKAAISQYNAGVIHSKYPNYSIEYLLGYSEYRNEGDKTKAEVVTQYKVEQSVERLAMGRGFQMQALSSFDIEEYKELTKDGHRSLTDLENVQYFERIENADSEALTLTAKQWSDFCDEVSSYIEMRLGKMFERGGW